jgi:DNA repair protein RecO (recombination protein O)
LSGEGGHIELAIALSTTRHKDGVAILKVFTREHGIIGCLVREGTKGARRAKHLHAPLSMLHLLGLRTLKGDLHRFDRADRPLPQQRTLLEVPRSAVAMFLAEVVLRTVESDAPHPGLFDALWRTAEALETEDSFTRLHLAFLVEAVHVQGLQPDAPVVAPPGMGRFNLASAEWESGPPIGDDFLSPSDATAFLRIQGTEIAMVRFQSIPSDVRNRLVLHHVHYLQLHLSSPKALRSWDVVRTVLAE